MPAMNTFANVWKNLQELDLRPLREAARQEVTIAIVGPPGSGRHTLAMQLRSDPARPRAATLTPVLILELEDAGQAGQADLIVLVLDATHLNQTTERSVIDRWTWAGKKLLVFYSKFDLVSDAGMLPHASSWAPARVVYGSALDRKFLEDEFANAVLDLLPDQQLALGRRFPLLRLSIAHRLINEVSFSNATYALGTGIAEVVPVLGLPLNLADIVVLTKGQALLVYKLGLAFGLSEEWQYYVSELGGVIGGGFLWRQAARSLIGLIPGWGIVPKVAIAYAGTFVVGHVTLQWYLTGRHVSRRQIQSLYRQAFAQGQTMARRLVHGLPRPRLKLPRPRLPRRRKAPPAIVCRECGVINDPDALYCKQCGASLAGTEADEMAVQ